MKQNPQLFDINAHLRSNAVQHKQSNNISRITFETIWKKVKNHFNEIYDNEKMSSSEHLNRQDLEHKAIEGNEEAERILTDEIEDYLRSVNLLGMEYPRYYESLPHACFHEIYRFGPFYKWQLYPESPSAIIQGKEQWYKVNGRFVRQDEELRDDEHIQEIIRALKVYHPGLVINEASPQAEFDMEDGSRVTIVVPPRSLVSTIIFRRFTVSNYSFLEQANIGTIDQEDVRLFRLLSKAMLNTIVAGPPESGKSTFLKTVYSERDPELVAVLIESDRESFLKKSFPDRLVHDFYTKNGDVQNVMRTALRVDHDFVIVQEVRGIEAEGAIGGTERGTRGLLMTYHITNPEQTPLQLARHITDEFPSRREINEVRRVAEQLDLGYTMQTFENNEKRITSVYEICYDVMSDKAWINYLMKYNRDTDTWCYNDEFSEQLLKRIGEHSKGLREQIKEHFRIRKLSFPMEEPTSRPIRFKGD